MVKKSKPKKVKKIENRKPKTEKQKNRKTEKPRDRKTEKPKNKKTEKLKNRKTEELKEEVKIEDILAGIEKGDKVEHLEKEKPKKKISHLTYTTPIRLYRRIALFFTIATFIILACALYFSLSKAEITIIPRKYLISADFNVNVESVLVSENSLRGVATEDVRSESMEFELEGEGQIKEGIARGEVTLSNESPSNQALVKTTRLLSESGVLFRLSEQITVPAGGVVTASVYADEAGESGDIGPTRFTIPGLSASLQDVIYGVSDTPMRGGKIVAKVVKEEDINNAKNVLKEKIISDVKESLDKLIDETKGLVFWPEITEEEVDAEPGDEREKFKVSMEIKTLGIIYDKKALESMAQKEVELNVPAQRVINEILLQDIKIDLVKYDASTETAILKIGVPARAVIQNETGIFSKDQLVGLKKAAAEEYLKNFEEIEDAKVKLRPFWLRRLPSLSERISIEIE